MSLKYLVLQSFLSFVFVIAHIYLLKVLANIKLVNFQIFIIIASQLFIIFIRFLHLIYLGIYFDI